jgi:hypothetical protein
VTWQGNSPVSLSLHFVLPLEQHKIRFLICLVIHASRRVISSSSDSEDEEEYFDAEDWPDEASVASSRSIGPLSGLMKDISAQLERLKTVLEATQTRILTLEGTFLTMQDRFSI